MSQGLIAGPRPLSRYGTWAQPRIQEQREKPRDVQVLDTDCHAISAPDPVSAPWDVRDVIFVIASIAVIGVPAFVGGMHYERLTKASDVHVARSVK